MTSALARDLMEEFARATGIEGGAKPRRYLWTDAFAVCNYLGLFREKGDTRYLRLAEAFVQQVHRVLGRHRADDQRSGWISGLSDDEGERHPTVGGLRIGKPRPERRPNQPFDQPAEWDQDGQYFHYLTKWAHALVRMCGETGNDRYRLWAAELMETAHRGFTCTASFGAPKRMVWKMSIDLTRPQVASMGQLDPLDGLVACLEIQAVFPQTAVVPTKAIDDFAAMCEVGHSFTDDPLGIGGLLDDAARLSQFDTRPSWWQTSLLPNLWAAADHSLRAFEQSAPLQRPHIRRLAFRELGLAIGLQGLDRVEGLVPRDSNLALLIARLVSRRSLADSINRFWSEPPHRLGPVWSDHCDINSVMLATSLAPAGYLASGRGGAASTASKS